MKCLANNKWLFKILRHFKTLDHILFGEACYN